MEQLNKMVDDTQNTGRGIHSPQNTGRGIRSPQNSCICRVFSHHPTPEDQDKGFAWLVLLWSTLSGFLTTGFFYGSYGPLNIMLPKEFGISLTQSSLICSLNSLIWHSSAPISSVLIKKLSCRTVQITGGCMIVIGLGSCAFVDKVWQLYLLYGVLAAFGGSFCCVSVPGVLVHHFQRHKDLAFSVSILGNRVGGSVWASLSQLMFSTLGFSKTMGTVALIEILTIIAGFFMTEQKPLEKDEERQPLLSSDPSSSSDPEIVEGTKCETLDKMTIHSDEINKRSSHNAEKPEVQNNESSGLVQGLKTLLCDWTVWLLLFNFGLWSITCHGFYFFINDYVVKYSGISETDAAFGVSLMGIGSIVGCLLNICTSKMEFNRLILYTPMPSIFGLASICLVFTNGKTMLYLLTFTFGVSYGLTTSNMYAVCYSFYGADLMTILFGLGMGAQGITGLLTGPVCSYLQTQVHRTAGIAFSGSAGIAASLVMIPILIKSYRNP